MAHLTSGLCPATIMLVVKAPHVLDYRKGSLFNDEAGRELVKMLNEAGITSRECYAYPLHADAASAHKLFLDDKHQQPSPELLADAVLLREEIKRCNPNVIITFGDAALYALHNTSAITSWRGSTLEVDIQDFRKVTFVPVYSASKVLQVWEWRSIVVHDLHRAKRAALESRLQYPDYNFSFPSEFTHAQNLLTRTLVTLNTSPTPIRLSCDIETIRRELACVGIASSSRDAYCIPLRTSKEYWTLEEEVALVKLFHAILSHKNAKIVGQNYLYDAQYFARKWGINPRLSDDTMFMQHVMWAGTSKSLDFLASMYASFYQYWKDDLQDYKKAPEDDLKFFRYNCTDCCYTWEIAEACDPLLDKLKLRGVYDFQIALWHAVFNMMLRGVKIHRENRAELTAELMSAAETRRTFIEKVVGYDLNPRSSKQMQKFLYDELKLPVVLNRKTKKPSANFDALVKLCDKEPLLFPIADALIEQRSIGVFLSTFVQAQLDEDFRMRCSYNPAGTETFRFSSSENAFGSGTNLQNIPAGSKKKTRYQLPNIRKLFVPDQGCTIFDVDLDRADLQVVVWEANDAELKVVLRKGIDMHCYSACSIYDLKGIPMDELAESHPNYREHRGRIGEAKRGLAKAGVHATNYFCQARTLAGTLGITVHEADKFINAWLDAHPGIRRWHERIERQLQTTRQVTNRFGYRRYYFGRVEEIVPEALAWIPQSTVAVVINRGLVAIDTHVPEVELLLQVHDSLAGQYKTHIEDRALRAMHPHLLVRIPYDDPLIIPVGLKVSTKSWGDCKDKEWPDGTQA